MTYLCGAFSPQYTITTKEEGEGQGVSGFLFSFLNLYSRTTNSVEKDVQQETLLERTMKETVNSV